MKQEQTMPCASCGYDVAGIALEGKCPECGGAVWASRTQFLGQLPIGHAVEVGEALHVARVGLRVVVVSGVLGLFSTAVLMAMALIVGARLAVDVRTALYVVPSVWSAGFAVFAIGARRASAALGVAGWLPAGGDLGVARVGVAGIVWAAWACAGVCALVTVGIASMWLFGLAATWLTGRVLAMSWTAGMGVSLALLTNFAHEWLSAVSRPSGPTPSRAELDRRLGWGGVTLGFIASVLAGFELVVGYRTASWATLALLASAFSLVPIHRILSDVTDRYLATTRLIRGVVREG